ncbi:MAG: hypothetical protein VST68_11595 [Nitrospirota bacterium]|nr:hypothetical protein [Nitrospirota bacterium]
MRTIGLSSVTAIVLTFLTLAVVFWSGIMDPGRLNETHQIAFFFVGFLAALVSMWFLQFWGILKPSSFCLTVCREGFEKKEDDVVLVAHNQWVLLLRHNEDYSALEIPPSLMRILYTLLFVFFFLITIDNRGMRLISEAPGKVNFETSLYCPVEEEEEKEEEKPGCRLVERAFELGLVKDLGDCQQDNEEGEDTIGEICTLRQYDEPYLHYAYRQVTEFFGTVVGNTRQALERQREHFQVKLESAEHIADHQLLPVLATPRSSHHLFTNLPDPDGETLSFLKKTFDPNHCVEEFEGLTHTLKLEEGSKRSASKALRHIYGHLLFNPKFDATVGFCREYEIHWNQPKDSCDRLSQTPALFLEEAGALEAVNTIIDRYQTNDEIDLMQESLSLLDKEYRTASGLDLDLIDDFKRERASKTVKTRRPIQDLVSFQCFIAGEDSIEEFSDHEFELSSQKFRATEISVPQKELEELYGKSIQVRLYDPISKLLAPKFVYSQLLSKQAVVVASDGAVTEEMFEHEDYALTRLELLRNSDIFLGNEWIHSRDDILALYPWHHHLRGYIKNFRKTYRTHRGRM